MKLFKNHNKRVEKITNYVSQNKIFVVIAIIVAVALLGNLLFNSNESVSPDSENAQNTAVTENDETTDEETVEEVVYESGWRFYFIDVVILAVGGGICLVMILRERRKRKEKL